jgi:hypothetical protein
MFNRLLWFLLSLGVLSQVQAQTPQKSYEFDVAGTKQWLDTGIDLLAGARISIAASGPIQYPQAQQAATPDGMTRGWKDLMRVMPVNQSGRGALIGKIGNDDAAIPFLIGSNKEIRAPLGGRLWIGLNQTSGETAEGSYHVTVQILDPGDASKAMALLPDQAKPLTVSGIDNHLFEKIPRRIGDLQGNPGDMVNFLILGTEGQMRGLFQSAGWVTVDKTKKDAVLHGLVESLSKQSYVSMPMSELYLFGRPQDYGMAHAEPFKVVESRHHLRLWKAPFLVDGQTLWVGAATHDIGFDRDQRNNGLTHKIDPNIDDERKYLAESLSGTGLVAQLGYFLPDNPLKEAHTATGGSFRSDGNVLVLVASDAAANH